MKHKLSLIHLICVMTCHLFTHSLAYVCGRFNIGGPCVLLPSISTTTTPKPGVNNAYCMLACSEGNDDIFFSLCNCATTTSTTIRSTITTTTARPESCYYTRTRPARLRTVAKRIFSGVRVATECDYPGVVGIYNATNQKFLCMGILLEENRILIDNVCLKLVNSTKCVAAVKTYEKPTDLTVLPAVVASSAKLLDPTGAINTTYVVALGSPVQFNDGCIQPACVPNLHLPLSDVDLADCRIVGYGETNDTFGSTSSNLLEIKVKVNPISVPSGVLKYTRYDGKSARTGPCFSDHGSPLICSHKMTSEWVTIGVVTNPGFMCTQGTLNAPVINSLLYESKKHGLYDGLQEFKYIPS